MVAIIGLGDICIASVTRYAKTIVSLFSKTMAYIVYGKNESFRSSSHFFGKLLMDDIPCSCMAEIRIIVQIIFDLEQNR